MSRAGRSVRVCAAVAVLLVFGSSGMAGKSAPPLAPPSGATVNVSTESELQQAVKSLRSDTTILLAPGVYQLSSTLWINGALERVEIRGATDNPGDVVLAGPGMRRASFGLVPYGIYAGGGAQGVTIANLTIRDIYQDAIVFAGVQDPSVYNVRLVDSGGPFIRALADESGRPANHGVVDYATVEYTATARDASSSAIDIAGGEGWRVSHSTFRNMIAPARQIAAPAIHAWHGASGTVVEADSFVNCAQGVTYGADEGVSDHSAGIIRNNVFFRAPGQAGDAAVHVNGSPDTQVLNNTVYASGTFPVAIEYRFAGAQGVVVANNLADGSVVASDGASGTETNNLPAATPDMFVDPARGDLHLTASAASAIDRGITAGAVTDDFDGVPRPQGRAYDIGAFEFGARSSASATKLFISGRVTRDNRTGVSGVTIAISGGRTGSYTTNGFGLYSISGLAANADYTVTPSKSGFHFSPTSLFFHALTSSVAAASFVAIPNGSTPPPTPPAIQLTAPADGSSFSAPATVRFSAAATGDGITRVEFYAGSTLVASDTSSPYQGTWFNAPAGTYALKAVARTSSGSSAQSAPVTITVGGGAPSVNPTVTLTAPANGATFTAPATIPVSASVTGTVARVDFYAGPDKVGSASSAPYTMTGTDVAAGTYVMKAVAITPTGGVVNSTTATITVAAAPGTPPPPTSPTPAPGAGAPPVVTLTSPAAGSSFTAPATIALAATATSSGSTIASLDFYANGVIVATSTSAPYTFTWTNVAAGTYSLTAIATDANGVTGGLIAAVVSVGGQGTPTSPPPTGTGGLLQAGNLVHQGAFHVPGGIHAGGQANAGFKYGGTALAYNPVNNSLYLAGHDWDQFVGEVSVPALGGTGTLLQNLVDPTEGKLASVNPSDSGSKKLGGMLVLSNSLVITGFSFYDGSGTQALSHFMRPLSLSTKGQVVGPYRVGSLGGGFYAGYMGVIPAEWQAALGGSAITGQCCLSVISRTSYGPAAFAFNPTVTGQTASSLLYYTGSNPLEPYGAGGSHPLFNGTTKVRGVVFPKGTSSVLFIGSTGVGAYCYGQGTSDSSLNGKGVPGESGVQDLLRPDQRQQGRARVSVPIVRLGVQRERSGGREGRLEVAVGAAALRDVAVDRHHGRHGHGRRRGLRRGRQPDLHLAEVRRRRPSADPRLHGEVASRLTRLPGPGSRRAGPGSDSIRARPEPPPPPSRGGRRPACRAGPRSRRRTRRPIPPRRTRAALRREGRRPPAA